MNCQFSPDRKYRYTLWRRWGLPMQSLFDGNDLPPLRGESEFVMIIGLNPSTADETKDDPTIRRCQDFAFRWGYPAMCMTNLFGFRATDPDDMKREPDPVGQDNNHWLLDTANKASVILCAWGNHGSHTNRDLTVLNLLLPFREKQQCLKKTKSGQPQHPLYIAADIEPILYQPI